ncbi:MAG: sigma-70 family RNA polymerase sigma factor [Planctomycetota bacterium]|nr:sigma-70 family RNA polymerase sigma factor [Planctomycetota bacterium]
MKTSSDASWLDVPRPPRPAHFATTCWSMVRRAGGAPSPENRAALEELCATYWFPLYAFLRRKGAGPEEAEDLVQEILGRVFERRDLAGVDPGRGRFRAWRATVARNHLNNRRAHEGAAKRGGHARVLSLDTDSAEDRLAASPCAADDPGRAFERAWARTLLSRTLDGVRDDWHGRGRGELFEALRPALEDPAALRPLAEIAADLEITEGAVRTASWRLRQAYGERLRAEVAETLADPADVDDELAHLLLVLSS